MKSLLQRSNPTDTAGCSAGNCIAYKGGRGSGGQGDTAGRTMSLMKLIVDYAMGEEKSGYVG